jgi:exopolysaccharide biosynthesis protein
MNRNQFRLIILVYSLTLTLGTGYSLLDAFVFKASGLSGSNILSSQSESNSSLSSIEPTYGEFSYLDTNMLLQIDVIRRHETQVYVAILTTTDHRLVKAAFGLDTFGKNFKEKTSVIANRKNAIFAINGDYYGFRDIGFVVRNGLVYRITARPADSDSAVVLNDQGIMSTFEERDTNLQALNDLNPWQAWSFGPVLINQRTLTVNPSTKVPYELDSNPRTAIGQIRDDQYIFVCSDGRTSESAGLSVYELASVFIEYGARFAYNLDGGGSATMWFNGRLINKPTNSGSTISERSISDIIYIGYDL